MRVSFSDLVHSFTEYFGLKTMFSTQYNSPAHYISLVSLSPPSWVTRINLLPIYFSYITVIVHLKKKEQMTEVYSYLNAEF